MSSRNKPKHRLLRWGKNTLRFCELLLYPPLHRKPAPLHDRTVWILSCWGGRASTARDLELRLENDDFSPFTPSTQHLSGHLNIGPIEVAAAHLKQILTDIPREKPNAKIALIGHSIGGIIGRYFLSALEGWRNIHTLIMLGTPNRGTPLASFGSRTPLRLLSPALKQLQEDSPFLTKLSTQPIPDTVHCVNIYSESDLIVRPSHARLPTKLKNATTKEISLEHCGHHELITSPEIYPLIRDALEEGVYNSRR